MSKFDKNSDKTSRPASNKRAPQKKSGGGTVLGIFLGLVVGVLIAFVVFWYLNKSPLPFLNKYEGAPKNEKEKPAPPGSPATAPQTPAALPGKPGDKPNEKQRFEFYGILEGKQPAATGSAAPSPATPATQAVPATPAARVVVAKAVPTEMFLVEVGAFQIATVADNL